MISNAPHCHYRRNPLADVICQFRFPEILSIETTFPSEFQEQIRDRFPIFRQLQEFIPEKGSALSPVAKPKSIVNYQFLSADGKWCINLTSRFISLSCSEYCCWEQFASHLDQPLAAFLQLYRPSHFDRKNPTQTIGRNHGIDKLGTSRNTHTGQEKRNAHFA